MPAAGALKATYPECEVVWVVDKRFAGVVNCCQHINTVLLRGEPVLGEFEAAFDLQGLLKSASILRGIRAKHKLGYHWQREGASFFSSQVLPDPSSFHIVDQYVDVVRVLCPKAETADFGLSPRDQDVASLASKFDLKQPYVVLNPGAGWISKRWPPAHFAQLADWLTDQGITPVAIGGNGVEDLAGFDEVQSRAQAPIVKMTGSTSVPELIALISRAKAHVGGDTGSTHIAAALGTSAVGLYSITRPQRSCPYSQIDNCLYDTRGLEHISSESVIAVLERELSRP
ncbi:MAG: glycosyltransferase family 9 protein [Fimbriimonadaceae bacterium]